MPLFLNEEELEPADVQYSSRSAVGEYIHRADVFYPTDSSSTNFISSNTQQ